MKDNIVHFFHKMRGNGTSPPRVSYSEIGWSWLGSFLGLGLVALMHYTLVGQHGLVLLIGSFGASAVLLYGAVRSPLAQPRNLIGGHVLSAIIGVSAFLCLGECLWLASALAVSLAIAAMHLTRTLHPPGGATALIAVTGGEGIYQLGYLYVLVPVALGACLMLLVALVINNIPKTRKYPEFWL